MTLAEPLIGWDADGVLLDSRAAGWRAAGDILALFGVSEVIDSPERHRKVFGAAAQEALVGRDDAHVLRAVHRLVMRARTADIRLFSDVLDVAAAAPAASLVITAAYAAGVRAALAAQAAMFVDIRGRETGPKEALLAEAAGYLTLYITDTVRDIQRCRDVGIPVVAVTWGYDTAADLRRARPDDLVTCSQDLARLLIHRFQSKEASDANA